jgi:hypothetical protein
MKTKIFTIAEVPVGLEHDWLQHLRDFDTAHPECHFVVASDVPTKSMQEMIDMMKIEPALTFGQIFDMQRKKQS